MNPQAIAGGAVPINYEAAAKIFSDTLCKELNLSILQAAYGVYQVANAAMMRTIRAVTTERGRMPTEYTLIAFGGSGPIHAADLASALGLSTVCIPLFPGLFSSLGLLLADLRYDYVMSIPSLLDQIDVNDLMLKREELLNTACQEVSRDNLDPGCLSFNTSLDMRYRRQSVELMIAMPMDVAASDLPSVLAERFHCEHERLYGYRRPAEPIVSVNLRLKATAPGQNASFAHLGSDFVRTARVERNEKAPSRRVYFGELGELSTPIMKRGMLLEQSCEGPAILEEFDTTIVVPPGWRASLNDGLGNLILQARPG